MRNKISKILGNLLIMVIAIVLVKINVNASNKESESQLNCNVIVGSEIQADTLANQISVTINNVDIEVLHQYDSGMTLINLKGKGNLDNILAKIESESGVEFAQPDYNLSYDYSTDSIEPQDTYFTYQWGLNNDGQLIGDYGVKGVDINILPAWQITEGSSQVVVGVLDSGIDINHEDLKDATYVNTGEVPDNGIDDDNNGYIDDVNGWDFYNNDNSVYDDVYLDFHGTFIAGILAASKNEIGICGVAPNVKIMPLKFISGDKGNTSDAIRAIEYAQNKGVEIINCSWGGTEYNKALKKAMKKSKILFVCSSGNKGYDTNVTKFYPTCFNINNIITVGAINHRGEMESFSNYGDDVDVVAPGMNVVGTTPGNGYLFGSGTSFAAPYVTGIAALIKSVKPDSTYKDIKKAIVKHVVVGDELNNKVNTSGRVDANKALEYVIHKYNLQ
ncbi:MAG: S8 family peptidase [Lachnotalea sp.]